MSAVTLLNKAGSYARSVGKWAKTAWGRVAPILRYPIVVGPLAALITYVVPIIFRPSPVPIENLIKQEAAIARGVYPHTDKDVDDYGKLFATGAVVLDYRTKELWQGKSAIVDRIRPLHFIALDHQPLNIHIDGVDAYAESNTTFVQDKPSFASGPGKEIWLFRKNSGRWEIISFEYDLP